MICPSVIRNEVNEKVTVNDSVENTAGHLGIKYHNPRGFRPGELVYEFEIEGEKHLFSVTYYSTCRTWRVSQAGCLE